MPSELHEGVSFVVLAKELAVAKTRLGLDPAATRRVALRLVARTVRAALGVECSGAVFVVTSDLAISQLSSRLGAVVIAEGRPRGMNRAAALGRDHALRARPHSPVAVMVADLPLLCSRDLDATVRQFRQLGAAMYVADHHSVGTTLLIHGPDSRPGLAFGRQSALMHRRMGYRPATRAPRGVRVDLDTAEDAKDFLADRRTLGAKDDATHVHAAREPARDRVLATYWASRRS